MGELEAKLGQLLSDPEKMKQIMDMAKMLSLGQPSQQEPQKAEPEPPAAPPFDPQLQQILSKVANQGYVDSNQQALLKALKPYLHQDRIQKLERAMGAAKVATAASAFLSAGGIRLLTSR